MMTYEPYHPFNPGHKQHLYEHMATTRQQCPVAHVFVPNAPVPFYFISRNEDVRVVLENKEGKISCAGNFEMEGARNKVVTQIDGEPHERLRTALRNAFNVRRYREITPYIEQKIQQLIDTMQARGERRGDLLPDLTGPLPTYTLFHLIGIPDENTLEFRGWIDDIIKITPAPIWHLPAWKNLSAFIDRLIEERRAHPQEDLLTKLIQNPAIAAEETQMHIFQLLVAGTDTTTQFLGNLFYQLLVQREQRWEKLLRQDVSITSAIEEGLRYDPPVIWLMRTAEQPITLSGVDIPAGSRLLVGLSSANHDESVWPNADEFELDRTGSSRNVSFGYGAHYCLGADLARKQSNLLLSALLKRMPTLRLVDGFEYVDLPAPVFHGPLTLPVTW
jgi:cytochrome P450